MLPFLKRKDEAQSSGIIVKTRASDEKPKEDQDDSSAAPEACMHALISAIHSKDAKAAVEALKDLMEVMDEPSDDESAGPHTYDSQNIKAAGEQS